MKPEYDFSRARRGPIAAPGPGKTRITIRLDDAVLEWFRKRVHASGGGNYQSLINEALRQRIAREEMAEYAVKPKGRRKTRGLN